jgi:DNA-binding beta-propeller fold protein YncE
VIDTRTNKIAGWVALPGTGYGAAATRDGRWLLVAIPSKNEVAVVDLKAMKVARSVEVPKSPQEILIPPSGDVAYVSCSDSGKIAVIDLATWKLSRTMTAGPWADGLAWAR